MAKRKCLTPAEHQIMLYVWKLESQGVKKIKVRDILELYPNDKDKPAYTTLATFVKILATKKYVSCSKTGNIIVVKPKMARADYSKLMMNYAINDYFDGDKEKMIEFIQAL